MKWSSSWKSSSKPGKQRLYNYNAPLHVKSQLLGSHLSKDLKASVGKRALRVRKGDKVKVMRGQFKGTSGLVERVETKTGRVFVAGVETAKKDGSKSLYPLQHSNIMIIELEGKDKRRVKKEKKQ